MASEGVNTGRRRFLTLTTAVVGGAGVAAAAVPFIKSWLPSARAQAAGAPVEADISKLGVGQRLTVEWRGQPVWIIHRSPEILAALPTLDAKLRDAKSENVDQQPAYAVNALRSIKPEIAVLVGTCTHLGCSPLFKPGTRTAAVRHRLEGRLLLPLPQLALRPGRARVPGRAGPDQPQGAALSLH
jgi:ubiquinol-cytochrome c reductase iron-sulfur subunit